MSFEERFYEYGSRILAAKTDAMMMAIGEKMDQKQKFTTTVVIEWHGNDSDADSNAGDIAEMIGNALVRGGITSIQQDRKPRVISAETKCAIIVLNNAT